MLIQEHLRFCGRHADAVAHIIDKRELVPWMRDLEHSVTTLCGEVFRPGWAGRATLDAVCVDCRRAMAPSGK